MTTAPSPPTPKRRWVAPSIAVLLVGAVVALVVALGFGAGSNPGPKWPNISADANGVTCAQAHDVSNEFTRAVQDVNQSSPNYDGVRKFGFTAPTTMQELTDLKTTLKVRQDQVDGKARDAAAGKCVDGANGNGTPTTGPCPEQFVQHFDPNTNGRFVSAGVKNSAEVLAAVGHDARYLAFIANQLGLQPDTSADKLLEPGNKCLSREGQDMFMQVKGALVNGNVTINESDEVPASYYNTGMIDGHPVVDQSPGIGGDRAAVSFTDKRTGKKLIVMKRCGNVGKENQTGLPPGKTEHERPPGSTPPPPTTTSPPPGEKCKPPLHENENGKCIESKNEKQGCEAAGQCPTQATGTNPSAPKTTEPRPSDPPTTYVPPAPPTTQPAPTRTSVPPVETPAPKPSDPATGCVPPPGMNHC